MSRPLFVYGTLRDADVLALAVGRVVVPAQSRPAMVQGCEVVVFPGRRFPAIRRAAGGVAEGVLIAGLDAGDMVALDHFEGEEYARQAIDLIVNGCTVIGDVYWPSSEIGPGTPWCFEDWLAHHKAGFLAGETKNAAEWRGIS